MKINKIEYIRKYSKSVATVYFALSLSSSDLRIYRLGVKLSNKIIKSFEDLGMTYKNGGDS